MYLYACGRLTFSLYLWMENIMQTAHACHSPPHWTLINLMYSLIMFIEIVRQMFYLQYQTTSVDFNQHCHQQSFLIILYHLIENITITHYTKIEHTVITINWCDLSKIKSASVSDRYFWQCALHIYKQMGIIINI